MKRVILIMLFIVISLTSFSQIDSVNIKKQEIKTNEFINCNNIVYELYPTTNKWNFIKLNTRNGKITIIQYSITDENQFEYSLNKYALVSEEEEINGRFKLHPTQNIYNFLLLDQISGKVWQVQWHFDSDKRFIIPIE
ncbi:MAG: hypothetical protein PHY75_06210 [Bacteroidales bacterium]|nr:hypothetical protein [Bacteroidales bacterium]